MRNWRPKLRNTPLSGPIRFCKPELGDYFFLWAVEGDPVISSTSVLLFACQGFELEMTITMRHHLVSPASCYRGATGVVLEQLKETRMLLYVLLCTPSDRRIGRYPCSLAPSGWNGEIAFCKCNVTRQAKRVT